MLGLNKDKNKNRIGKPALTNGALARSKGYISLCDAAGRCSYSQDYLSLLARRGLLKSAKFGRNWYTRQEWLVEYIHLHPADKKGNVKGELNGEQGLFDKLAKNPFNKNLKTLGRDVFREFSKRIHLGRWEDGSELPLKNHGLSLKNKIKIVAYSVYNFCADAAADLKNKLENVWKNFLQRSQMNLTSFLVVIKNLIERTKKLTLDEICVRGIAGIVILILSATVTCAQIAPQKIVEVADNLQRANNYNTRLVYAVADTLRDSTGLNKFLQHGQKAVYTKTFLAKAKNLPTTWALILTRQLGIKQQLAFNSTADNWEKLSQQTLKTLATKHQWRAVLENSEKLAVKMFGLPNNTEHLIADLSQQAAVLGVSTKTTSVKLINVPHVISKYLAQQRWFSPFQKPMAQTLGVTGKISISINRWFFEPLAKLGETTGQGITSLAYALGNQVADVLTAWTDYHTGTQDMLIELARRQNKPVVIQDGKVIQQEKVTIIKGEKGATGAPGEKGEKGETGAQGPVGPTGNNIVNNVYNIGTPGATAHDGAGTAFATKYLSGGELRVSGDTNLNTVTIAGAAELQSTANVNSDLTVGGNAGVRGALFVGAAENTPSWAQTAGTGYFASDLETDGSLRVDSNTTTEPAVWITPAPLANSGVALLTLGANPIVSGSGNGTFLAANPATFSGDFINLMVGDASKFKVDASGNIVIAGTSTVSGVSLIESRITPQLTVRYDTDHQWLSSVSASGTLTWDLTSATNTPEFTMADPFNIVTSTSVDVLDITASTTADIIDIKSSSTDYLVKIDQMGAGGILSVGSAETPRLVVTRAGNVGIGNTTPTSTLAVAGTFNVQNATTNNSNFFVDVNGNVGVGTTTPLMTLNLANGDGGILASGYLGSGAVYTTEYFTGLGTAITRLLWYPRKSAFRAGAFTESLYLDDANMGNYSVGFGYNPYPKGQSSFVAGYLSSAAGDTGVALGYNANATGNYSTALGETTYATGNYSTALGTASYASNSYARSIGHFVEASGSGSFAFGNGINSSNKMTNAVANSLGVGFNSTIPTFFVGPGTGAGTIGNVGIGTTDPDYRLEVVGNTYLNGSATTTGTQYLMGDISLGNPTTATGVIHGYVDAFNTPIHITATTTFGPEYGWAMEQLMVTNGRIDFKPLDGKAEFRVKEEATQFNVYNQTTGMYYIKMDADALVQVDKIADMADTRYYLNPAVATTSMTVAGNIGIATLDPQYQLHVVGTSYLNGNATTTGAQAIGGDITLGDAITDRIKINAYFLSDLIPADNVRNIGSPTNRWYYGYYDKVDVNTLSAGGTDISGTTANELVLNSTNVTDDTEDTSLVFERGAPDTNAAMRWDASENNINFNFPIWIEGTDSGGAASSTITVKEGVNQGGYNIFQLYDVSNNLLTQADAEGHFAIGAAYQNGYGLTVATTTYLAHGITMAGYATTSNLTVSGNATTTGSAYIGGDLTVVGSSVWTGGSSFNSITTTDTAYIGGKTYIGGNLGIGTTAPTYPLTINGDLNFTAINKYIRVAGVGILTSDGSNAVLRGSTNMGIALQTNAVESMRINSSGNVGIATTNPTAFLEISTTTTDWTGTDRTRPFLRIATKTTEALYVAASGNVGIGTTRPTSGLGLSGRTLEFMSEGESGYEIKYTGTSAFNIYNIGSASANALHLGTSNTPRLSIDYLGNVGIGTITPTSTLQTVGTFSVATTSALGFNKREVFNVNGTNSFATTTVKDYFKVVQADETTSLYVDKGGNVGVGTTNPTVKLMVSGGHIATNGTYGLYSYGTGNPGDTNTEFFTMLNSTAGSFFNSDKTGSGTARAINFQVGGATKMLVKSDGNVGIGTTNPTQILDVFKDGGMAGVMTKGDTSAIVYMRADYDDSGATGDDPYINFGIGGGDGNPSRSISIGIDNSDSDKLKIDTRTSAWSAPGDSTLLTIQTDGNVGIGTTGPGSRLDISLADSVVSDGVTQLTLIDSSALAADVGAGMTFKGVVDGSGTLSTMGAIKMGKENANASDYLSYLSFYTRNNSNFSERMRINSSGNIGIGTTGPTTKLQVVSDTFEAGKFLVASSTTLAEPSIYVDRRGNVGIGTTNPGAPGSLLTSLTVSGTAVNTSGAVLRVQTAGGTAARGDFYAYSDGHIYLLNSYTSGRLSLGAGGVINRMTIDTNGNVGISTTAPVAMFEISTSSTDWVAGKNIPLMRVASETTEALYVGASGNVGIGTTAPENKLEIVEDRSLTTLGAESGTLVLKTDTYSAGETVSILFEGGINEIAKIIGEGSANGGSLYFYTDDNYNTVMSIPAMTINYKGNIGIGTTGPTTKLQVVSDTYEAGKFLVASSTTLATPSLYVSNTGNVGIGTTNPTWHLEVNGGSNTTIMKVKTTSANGYGATQIENDIAGRSIVTLMGGSTYSGTAFGLARAGLAQIYVNNGPLVIGSADNYNFTLGAYNIPIMTLTSGGNVGIGTSGPIALFEINTSTTDWAAGNRALMRVATKTTEALYIGASGNVGIGTTGPAVKLSVAQSADAQGIRVYGYDDVSSNYGELYVDGGGHTQLRSSTGKELYFGAGSAGIAYLNGSKFGVFDDIEFGFGNDTDYSMGYNSANDTLQIVDGTTIGTNVRVAIDNQGNVGIGNTTPTGQFQISTTTLVTSAVGTEPRVGIGVTAPIAALQVIDRVSTGGGAPNGTTSNRGMVVGAKGTTGVLNLGVDGSGGFYSWIQSRQDNAANYYSLALNPVGGNVGIGTSNPTKLIHVERLTNDDDFALKINTATGISRDIGIVMGRNTVNSAGIKIINSSVKDYLGFNVNGSAVTAFSDAAQLVLNEDGNVGIGTTNPVAIFEVSTTTEDWPAGNRPLMRISTSGVEVLYVAMDGTIGIGTSAPGYQLDVYSNLGRRITANSAILMAKFNDNATTYPIRLENTQAGYAVGAQFNLGYGGSSGALGTSVAAGYLITGAEQTWTSTASTQDAYMSFSAALDGSVAEKMRINSAGNVGIGTTNPNAKFEVVGGNSYFATASTNSGVLSISPQGNAGGVILNSTYYGGGSGAYGPMIFNTGGANRMMIDSSGNVGIGNTNPTAFLEISTTTTDWAAGNRPLMRVATKTTEAFYIDKTGNVGIGSTNPGAKFEVADADFRAKGGRFYLTQSSPVNSLLIDNQTSGFARMYTNAAVPLLFTTNWAGSGSPSPQLYLASGSNVGIGTTNPVAMFEVSTTTTDWTAGTRPLMRVATQTTEAFYINAAGNVGLGITAPAVKMHIYGGTTGQTVALSPSSDNTTASILLMGATNVTGENAEIGYNGVANFFFIKEGGAVSTSDTKLVILRDSGNVGIGTTAPTTKLQVVSDTYEAGKFMVASSTTLATPSLYVANTGYVGMGTTAPGANIDIYDAAATVTGRVKTNASNAYASWSVANSSNVSALLLVGGTGRTGSSFGLDRANLTMLYSNNGAMVVGPADNYNLTLGAYNIPIMTLTGGGNVGIGTSGPIALFEINTTTTDWPAGNRPLMRVATKTTEAFYIDKAGNVGVGTTGPGAKLHLFNTTNGVTERIQGHASNYLDLISNSGGVQTINSQGGSMFVNSGGDINFDSGKLFIADGGNVGIGTTAPGTKFSVVQDTAEAPKFSVGSSTATNIYVNNKGNVGIGTSNPGWAFDALLPLYGRFIVSDESADSTAKSASLGVRHYTNSQNPFLYFIGQSNATGNTIAFGGGSSGGNAATNITFLTAANNTTALGTDRMIIKSTGNVGIATTNPIAIFEVSTTSSDWVAGGAIPLMRVATKTTEAFYINAAGNVGVGTTAPGAKLEISQSADSSGIKLVGYTDPTKNGTISLTNTGVMVFDTNNYGSFQQGGAWIWNFSSTGLDFATGKYMRYWGDSSYEATIGYYNTDNSFRITGGDGITSNVLLTVTRAGNVGVGATSPIALFEISTTTVDWAAGVRPLMRVATKTTEAFYIDKAGNIGIGTTAPATPFHLYSPVSNTGLVTYQSAADQVGFYMTVNANDAWKIYNNYGSFLFRNNTDNRTALELRNDGDIWIAQNGGNVGVGSITSPVAMFEISTTTEDWPAGNRPLMRVSTSGVEALYVNKAGNVGVGTTAGTYKFMVDWNADATNAAYVSDSNAWTAGSADYAEYFATADTDLQSGEVVCVDVTQENAVKRCVQAADPDLMGIVSTNPAFLGNAPVEEQRENNPNYVVVGMLGQVPAKVSAENGPVRPGDSLTSASQPGYIMRANAGDSTVGVALESLDSGMGTIQVLISRRNKSLTVEQVEESVTKRVADMKIEDEVNLLIAGAMDNLGVDEQIKELTVRVVNAENNLSIINNQLANNDQQLSIINNNLEFNDTQIKVLKNLEVVGEVAAQKIAVAEARAKEIVLGLETTTAEAGQATAEAGQAGDEQLMTNDETATSTDETATTTPEIVVENKEVHITVVEASSGELKLNVTGGAEFQGNVAVQDLVVAGKLVVLGSAQFADVRVKKDLVLDGAIIKHFSEANGETLALGDAVYISSNDTVSRAYADNLPFKPAVGLVVGFEAAVDEVVNTGARIVKVAMGGSVTGFNNLMAGETYYLTDLMYYINHTVDAVATTTDGTLPGSVAMIAPNVLGDAIQVLGVAKSNNELLIMPALNYSLVTLESLQQVADNALVAPTPESQPTTEETPAANAAVETIPATETNISTDVASSTPEIVVSDAPAAADAGQADEQQTTTTEAGQTTAEEGQATADAGQAEVVPEETAETPADSAPAAGEVTSEETAVESSSIQ